MTKTLCMLAITLGLIYTVVQPVVAEMTNTFDQITTELKSARSPK